MFMNRSHRWDEVGCQMSADEDKNEGHVRAKTGIAGLDGVLHGGFLKHRMYLVEGNPGAGKPERV